MTSEIYPPMADDEIRRQEEKTMLKEKHWLYHNIVDKSIDYMEDSLNECIQKLEDPTAYKLPISSNMYRNESMKGIMTRSSFYVSDLDVTIKLSNLPKSQPYRLKYSSSEQAKELQSDPRIQEKGIVVNQLVDCLDMIREGLAHLHTFKTKRETGKTSRECYSAEEEFNDAVQLISGLYKTVKDSEKSMKTQLDEFLFPKAKSVISSSLIHPVRDYATEQFHQESLLTNNNLDIDVDIYVSSESGSIVMDVRLLEFVNESPWNKIVDGLSYGQYIKREKPHEDSTDSEHSDSSQTEGSAGISGLIGRLGLFHVKRKPSDYKEHSYVYNGRVMLEIDRVKVEIQDPNLISLLAKLSALEHYVGGVNRKCERLIQCLK